MNIYLILLAVIAFLLGAFILLSFITTPAKNTLKKVSDVMETEF